MVRRGLSTALFAVVFSISIVFAASQSDDGFSKLMDGNKRFVSGNLSQKVLVSRRNELLSGQSPFAIIVTCSDSRVSPGLIFDQGLGDIFVIRVAGNVLDPVALGSIEYAAEHLHSHLLVLMGHEKCGAVSACLDMHGAPEGNIGAIMKKILPAVKAAKSKGGTKNEILANAIKANVSESYKTIMRDSPVLKHMIEKGELKVVQALYHLGSGEVEVLKTKAAAPATAEKEQNAETEHEQPAKRVPSGC